MSLQRYIAAWRGRRFRPGSVDCARFVAGWVRESTGRDLSRGFRYRSLRAGQSQLQAAGYADHVAYAAAHLDEVRPARAQVGDVAVVEGQFGLVAGEVIFVLRREGLGTVPLRAAERAFRP